jgi:iron complex transport system ATP-binding protein
MVPQETHAAFDFSVLDMVMMGRYPHLGPLALERADDLTIARDALAATGTITFEARRFATLSGGEKQRVVIAAALAQISGDRHGSRLPGPERRREQAEETVTATGTSGVLLLDEPTASLDLGYQLEVASLLRRLHEQRQLAIVISTHDLGLAGTLCDSLTLIRDGQVVASGPTDEVLTPANVRAVYGVEADVLRHASGQLMVVPLRRTGGPQGT